MNPMSGGRVAGGEWFYERGCQEKRLLHLLEAFLFLGIQPPLLTGEMVPGGKWFQEPFPFGRGHAVHVPKLRTIGNNVIRDDSRNKELYDAGIAIQEKVRSFPVICRRAIVYVFFSCILSAVMAIAQPGDRRLDTKARVLDLLFPLDVTPDPYLMKLTLRFGDSDTQFVVVIYPVYPVHPGGRSEIIRYSLAGMGDGELSQLISKMLAQNPDVTDREIAAKLKVNVSRSPIKYDALDRALKDLKAVQISPILKSRVAVDEYSEYEYWYDTWQESVHYTITGPFKDAPQDQLVQWMIRFRARLADLMETHSAADGSKPE